MAAINTAPIEKTKAATSRMLFGFSGANVEAHANTTASARMMIAAAIPKW